MDDEKTIREGLKNYVDWISLNFEVVGCFEDGKEAIDYIDVNEVNVVLTDIKMIEISGIQLAEYIHNKKPQIKVVLISGFKEFEFAKQAIAFDVVDYILKPIRVIEITRIFENICKTLTLEKHDTELKLKKDKQIDEVLELLKEQFFRDLILGALIDPGEIDKKIKLLGFDNDVNRYALSIIDIKLENYNEYMQTKWEYGKDRLDNALRNILGGETESTKFFTLVTTPGCFKIIAIGNSNSSIQSMKTYVHGYVNTLKENIISVFDMELEIVEIKSYLNILELSKSTETITIPDTDSTIDDNGIELILKNPTLIEQRKIFKVSILSGDASSVFSLLNNMVDKLKLYPPSSIHNFIINLFMDLFNSLSTIDISIQKVRQEKFDYSKLIKTENIEGIKKWARVMSEMIMEQILPDAENSNKLFIRKALEYITERFDQDLSLDEVASHVYLSPAYFCRLFKQETGENFINYIIKIRIKNAIKIMKSSNHKISEIGIMVGYKNSKYFSRVFKNHTGYTPSHYQMKIIKEGLNSDE
ncbi:MAG: response regulator [Spirochaetaceae bacterium]